MGHRDTAIEHYMNKKLADGSGLSNYLLTRPFPPPTDRGALMLRKSLPLGSDTLGLIEDARVDLFRAATSVRRSYIPVADHHSPSIAQFASREGKGDHTI